MGRISSFKGETLQAASRCQPAPSLLFFQNKGRETCSGDPFTSRTISSYIMTQAWLPANCCSELGKTISSPLRAASVHNAGFVPPCHRLRHVRESLAHPSSSEVAEGEGKEKPPCSEGMPGRAGGAGDGARLPAPSCAGAAGTALNQSSRRGAQTALTPPLKTGSEASLLGFLRFLVR